MNEQDQNLNLEGFAEKRTPTSHIIFELGIPPAQFDLEAFKTDLAKLLNTDPQELVITTVVEATYEDKSQKEPTL